MCVIIVLNPGQMLPYDLFERAVQNNPHGYGLILKDKKRLSVEKSLQDDKNLDPKVLYKKLEDNKDIERILHLRWQTVGGITEDNLHPFPVYTSDKRQVWFMHNGTLHNYNTNGYVNGQQIVQEKSDSRRFAEEVLSPLLLRTKGKGGIADIEDDFLPVILDKFWTGSHNRGILISNDQETLLLGDWKNVTIEGIEGTFLVSNNDYFNELKRGPAFEAKKKLDEEKRKAEEEKRRSSGGSTISNSTTTGLALFEPAEFRKQHGIANATASIWQDVAVNTDEGCLTLSNLTAAEITDMCKNRPSSAAELLFSLTARFRKLYLAKVNGTETRKAS